MDVYLIEMLLFITMLFSLASGMSPSEKGRIHNMYEDSYHKIDEILKTALSENNTEEYSSIEEHCYMAKIQIFEYADKEYKHKKVTLIDSNVSVTFDDLEHIKVPGLIRCTYRNDDVTEDEDETSDADDLDNKLIFSLVLTNIGDDDYLFFVFVFKDTENDNGGELVFLSEDARKIRNLKNSYKTNKNYKKMKDWLLNIKGNINTVELCKLLISKGEFAYEITILNGTMEIEPVHLSLDENQNVNVPGLLHCEIKHRRVARDHMFFAKYGLNDDKNSYLPVCQTGNRTTDGKYIYVLEPYRLYSTSQS